MWLIAVLAVAACTPRAATPSIPDVAPSRAATASPSEAEVVPTPGPSDRPAMTPAPLRALQGAVPSAGCDQAALETGDQTLELTIDGEVRTALLHTPTRAAPAVPLPLVVVFHGTLMDGPQMVGVTGFSARADEDGFLVAYPSAVGDLQQFNAIEDPDHPDDLAFERALLDEIEARACVDQHRVYAAGFSAGGAMTQLVACRDDRIVAIALVATPHGEVSTRCLPKRPVPAVTLHGMLDPLVPWRGGLNPLPEASELPPSQGILEWAETWARSNGCDPEPRELEAIGDWVVPFEWQDCKAPVIVYRIGNGGHNWPGGTGMEVFGTINPFDATAASVTFFLDNAIPPDSSFFTSPGLGYRVRVPEGWPRPWVGQYGYHQTVNGAVTFPVGEPEFFDVWATQMVLSAGPIKTGIPTPSGLLRGASPRVLARHLIEDVPGYADSDLDVSVDGEPALVLEGSSNGVRLPTATVFTHGDRAYLLFVYHEIPFPYDDRSALRSFVAAFEFID
jgi:polyhydroxybutyrate depolymerase